MISKSNPAPRFFVSKQERAINIKSFVLEKFNIGYRRLISSILWIGTILESDHEHYNKRDLNSWMFLRFQTLMILEPEFLPIYTFGGPYLSIIKDDLPGASYIYDQGLKIHPNDYELLKNSGFHYYFEVRDIEKAKPIYKKLKSFKNLPLSIATTISRIEADEGYLEDALIVLNELASKYDQDSFFGKKILVYKNAIQTEIDLNCLNSKKSNCNTKNLYGLPYIKQNNQYISSIPWKNHRVKLREFKK